MLIQFNFRNFKSYKNANTLDMTSTTITEHPYNLTESFNGEEYIKVAAIYGANASGKSAVLEAFSFMRFFVLSSFRQKNIKKGIPIKRFALDKANKNGKSEFEVFFRYKGKEYQYGFVLDNKRIYEEWLYKRDFRFKTKPKYNTLFERRHDQIRCTKNLKNAQKFIEHVEDDTLFLSMLSNLKINDAKQVAEWFLDATVIDFSHSILEDFITEYLTEKAFGDEDYQSNIEGFLKAIDTGIEGIRIEKLKSNLSEEEDALYKIHAQHKLHNDEGTVEIPFIEESSGTQKMFCLFHFLQQTLKDGDILLVDELDAKLHPILLRYIINMFHDPDINKNNAQLVYTTHDPYTLTKETFRRDQIWFAEKDSNGESKLYSLAEFKLDGNKKVRKDASYDKDYLAGRYGAIPLLKEFRILED